MENNTTTHHKFNTEVNGVAIYAITMSSIGVVANSVLLYLFTADSYFRKMIYHVMLISCLTDLIANAASIVSNIVYFNHTINTTILCRILSFLIYTSYGISIMNLSLIAIYRYLSIVKPFSKIYVVYKKSFMIIGEIIIWMICIGTVLPDIMYLQTRQPSGDLCDYEEITPFFSAFFITFVIIYYIIPSTIIIIFYWKIIIHQRNYVRPGQSSNSGQLDAIRKDKLIKSIMIVSACYVFTTWPMFAVFLGMAITRKTFTQIWAENRASFWIGTFSISSVTIIPVLNPFLYFKLDENIRRSFKNRFLKRCTVSTDRI